MAYPISKFTMMPLIRLLFLKKLTGLENLPKPPFILASNHTCHLDPFILGSKVIPKINKKITFIAKTEFTNYFGHLMQKYFFVKWGNCIILEKEGTKNRGHKAINQSIILLKQGNVVCIFPEGMRTYTGSLLEGKTGVIRMALASGTPIVPVGITNGEKLLPRNKAIPRIWNRVTINIGKPYNIKPQKITKEFLRKQTTILMNKIGKLADKEYKH